MEDRTVLRLAIGFVATFYGRHFTYIILYAQVLRGRHTAFFSRLRREIEDLINKLRASRPRLREATNATQDALRRIGPLQEAYQRASASGGDEHEAAVLQMELDELQQDLLRMGHAGTSVIGALDPDRLGSLAREVYLGLAALADAATANGASRLGITFDIGERVISRVDAVLTPLLYRLLEELRRRSSDVARLLDDPRFERFPEFFRRAICSSIGLSLAFHVERTVFAAANAVWGAELLLSGALGLLPYRWQQRALEAGDEAAGQHVRHAALGVLAACGAYYQLLGPGQRLPRALWLVTLLPLVAERWVQGATMAVRM
jgi:hypothetical protein